MSKAFKLNLHDIKGRHATAARSVAIASATDTVDLPGGISMTMTATFELLADGTEGNRTGVEWTVTRLPSSAGKDAFFRIFEAVIDSLLGEAHRQAMAQTVLVRPDGWAVPWTALVEQPTQH